MTGVPQFSVVMPVFNGGEFLREAVESVLRQDFEDFELIIVDDGSTDGSTSMCRAFAAVDSRIHLIEQRNAGVAAAMNSGIAAATAAWVVVMHADDVMLPNRIATLSAIVDGGVEEIGIITAGVELIADDGRVLGRGAVDLPENPFFLRPESRDHIVGGLYHTALLKEALLQVGCYDPACQVNEDVDLFNRMVEAGYGVLVLAEVLMRYRIHSASASSARSRELLLHWRYVKARIRARRDGTLEPSWDEFLENRRRRPWVVRSNEWRKDMAKTYYREAASAFAGRRCTSFVVSSACSLLLQPRYFLTKWTSRRR